ncbi:hypothetical protein ABK040_004279 [Willaertia magna]
MSQKKKKKEQHKLNQKFRWKHTEDYEVFLSIYTQSKRENIEKVVCKIESNPSKITKYKVTSNSLPLKVGSFYDFGDSINREVEKAAFDPILYFSIALHKEGKERWKSDWKIWYSNDDQGYNAITFENDKEVMFIYSQWNDSLEVELTKIIEQQDSSSCDQSFENKAKKRKRKKKDKSSEPSKKIITNNNSYNESDNTISSNNDPNSLSKNYYINETQHPFPTNDQLFNDQQQNNLINPMITNQMIISYGHYEGTFNQSVNAQQFLLNKNQIISNNNINNYNNNNFYSMPHDGCFNVETYYKLINFLFNQLFAPTHSNVSQQIINTTMVPSMLSNQVCIDNHLNTEGLTEYKQINLSNNCDIPEIHQNDNIPTFSDSSFMSTNSESQTFCSNIITSPQPCSHFCPSTPISTSDSDTTNEQSHFDDFLNSIFDDSNEF